MNDFAPRIGFALAADSKTAIRGGFGTSYVHYTRAGSGDIQAINAPQALFVAVNQNNLKPTPTNHCVGTPTVTSIGNLLCEPGTRLPDRADHHLQSAYG
ncbi:outer membrane beta-barrel protein [Granulicella tundricola]